MAWQFTLQSRLADRWLQIVQRNKYFFKQETFFGPSSIKECIRLVEVKLVDKRLNFYLEGLKGNASMFNLDKLNFSFETLESFNSSSKSTILFKRQMSSLPYSVNVSTYAINKSLDSVSKHLNSIEELEEYWFNLHAIRLPQFRKSTSKDEEASYYLCHAKQSSRETMQIYPSCCLMHESIKFYKKKDSLKLISLFMVDIKNYGAIELFLNSGDNDESRTVGKISFSNSNFQINNMTNLTKNELGYMNTYVLKNLKSQSKDQLNEEKKRQTRANENNKKNEKKIYTRSDAKSKSTQKDVHDKDEIDNLSAEFYDSVISTKNDKKKKLEDRTNKPTSKRVLIVEDSDDEEETPTLKRAKLEEKNAVNLFKNKRKSDDMSINTKETPSSTFNMSRGRKLALVAKRILDEETDSNNNLSKMPIQNQIDEDDDLPNISITI
jgi:hypothetical protein